MNSHCEVRVQDHTDFINCGKQSVLEVKGRAMCIDHITKELNQLYRMKEIVDEFIYQRNKMNWTQDYSPRA